VTRIALITTTINVPHVLAQWVKTGMGPEDVIIVAGDMKSPHREIRELLDSIERTYGIDCRYLDPKMQAKWKVSDEIGWNCIQRRNIALLEAMALKPEYILTIDDDNAPTNTTQVNILTQIMAGTEDATYKILSTNTGWYNPGRQCLTDQMMSVTHRGFPLSQRHVKPFYAYSHRQPPIGVAAMLWTGEPDIDAVERITCAPNVTRVTESVVVLPGTWAPFNTQATMIRGDLAPALFMFPHVGRYDDIWASYVYRKVADKRGYGAFYGRPAVHQDRNPHDLVRDLEEEIFGMCRNEQIIKIIQDCVLPDDTDDVLSDVSHIFGDLMNALTLHGSTHAAMYKWTLDVGSILNA
jgi:hypothetical protein